MDKQEAYRKPITNAEGIHEALRLEQGKEKAKRKKRLAELKERIKTLPHPYGQDTGIIMLSKFLFDLTEIVEEIV